MEDPMITDDNLQYFTYEHLSPPLREASAPFCELALKVAREWPDNPQTRLCIQLLLQAKDAGVRARVHKSIADAVTQGVTAARAAGHFTDAQRGGPGA
jgi:hypothetical protein